MYTLRRLHTSALFPYTTLFRSHASRYVPAWPAHLVKLIVNASGVTLFVVVARLVVAREEAAVALVEAKAEADASALEDRKSTRLNSSHLVISYAVFSLKKKIDS